MRVRLTGEADGAIALESTYRDWEPVLAQFKGQIPYDGRRWDAERKRWIVTALYAADLLAFLQQVGAQILDERPVELLPGTAIPAMPDELKAAFDTLHLQYDAPLGACEATYKFFAKHYHPDHQGNLDAMVAINQAIEVIRRYLGGA
jgi:hypothetical protein